jgi:pSer/pThr/pTyr-binding forkhead associated (FHA) protein
MHKFQLNAASSALLGKSWSLEGETLIGSSQQCHVLISAEGISPRHAMVILDEGRLSIEDLDSATGTWVNGERIVKSSLASGDEIRIGPHRLLLQAPGLRPQRVIRPEAAQPASRPWLAWLALLLTATAVAAWYFRLVPFVG